MIFVDAHVHVYGCFDLDLLLDSALKNFQEAAAEHAIMEQPGVFVLLLTEGKEEHWFQGILDTLDGKDHGQITERWTVVSRGGNGDFLRVCRDNVSATEMYIVAGRQVITREKIEVLALFVQVDCINGLCLHDTIDAINKADGLPVLPWGVGKWFGKRGENIKRYLENYG